MCLPKTLFADVVANLVWVSLTAKRLLALIFFDYVKFLRFLCSLSLQFGCVLTSEHSYHFLLLFLCLLLLLVGFLFIASFQFLVYKLWEDVLDNSLVKFNLGIGSVGKVEIKLVLMVAQQRQRNVLLQQIHDFLAFAATEIDATASE